jgi:hypothetical protein
VPTVDYFSETDWFGFFPPSDLYTVITATAGQMEPVPGELVDTVEVSFHVTGRPGTFTVELPVDRFRFTGSGVELTSAAQIVEAMYEL